MISPESITYWIERLKVGERAAVQKLWERYFHRLVALARVKLGAAPRRAADEEDVALSAFDSFCRAAEADRFPQLEDRDDLWKLLVVLASRKAINLTRQENAAKRGGGKVVAASGDADGDIFADLIGKEPDPALAVAVGEQCQHLLDALDDGQLRQVALWKLEGYTNLEIAAKLGRAVATIERKLKCIRECWELTLPQSTEE